MNYNYCKLELVFFCVLLGTVTVFGDDIKVNTCCTKTSKNRITTPITGYILEEEALPCVEAVIFISGSKKYCSDPNTRWAKKKIAELQKLEVPKLPNKD